MGLLKSLKDKALLARQLSLSDWLVLAEAWWLLLFFYLALRWTSYEHLIIPDHPILEKSSDPPHALFFAQQLQRLVGFASRLHLIPMTCLVKSLTLQKILYRRNIPAQVCIGVNKTLAEIHAHAWVEVKGDAVGELGDISERFKVLNRSGE
jgi:hypothetical protein